MLIALGTVAGIVIGILYREPSLGLVVGVAAGIALALLVWAMDRRRRG